MHRHSFLHLILPHTLQLLLQTICHFSEFLYQYSSLPVKQYYICDDSFNICELRDIYMNSCYLGNPFHIIKPHTTQPNHQIVCHRR